MPNDARAVTTPAWSLDELFFERFLRNYCFKKSFVLTFVLLVLVFDGVAAALFLLTREIWIWLDLILLSVPFGVVPAILGVLMLKFLRDKRRSTFEHLTKDLTLDHVALAKSRAARLFSKHNQVIVTVVAVSVGLLYQIYLQTSGVWSHSFVWWVQASFWVLLFTFPVIGLLLFFCVSTAWLVYQIGLSLKFDEKNMFRVAIFRADKMVGLGEISSLSLVVTLAWAVVGLYFVGAFIGREVNQVLTVAMFGYGAVLLILFLVPLMSVHSSLKKEKEEIMKKVGERIVQYENELKNVGEKAAFRALADLYRHKILLDEAEKIKEWPFSWAVLSLAIGEAFAPLLGYFIKALLGMS